MTKIVVVRNTQRLPNKTGPNRGMIPDYISKAYGERSIAVAFRDDDDAIGVMRGYGEVVERPADLETVPLRDK